MICLDRRFGDCKPQDFLDSRGSVLRIKKCFSVSKGSPPTSPTFNHPSFINSVGGLYKGFEVMGGEGRGEVC